MGQAKAKKDRRARLGNVSFSGRLQTMANETVKAAEYLVENGTAVWMDLQMPDGKIWAGLVFKPSIWEVKDGKLILKSGGE
jgi:hypothetical protein